MTQDEFETVTGSMTIPAHAKQAAHAVFVNGFTHKRARVKHRVDLQLFLRTVRKVEDAYLKGKCA